MKNKMSDLRNHLFETLEALRDKDQPMDIARARAVCDVAGKLIDSAKVEVELIKAVGRSEVQESEFFPRSAEERPRLTSLPKPTRTSV
jgi:hypothetical protein